MVHDMNMQLIACDEVLSTTRAVRRRLDLQRRVDREVLVECAELAIQAPTGMNSQGWRFLFLVDAARKRPVAEFYRRGYRAYKDAGGPQFAPGDPRAKVRDHLLFSQDHLAEHLEEVPVLLIPLVEGRLPEQPTTHLMASFFGSIIPAVWSFMLAARARGLGTAWTTSHLRFEREVAEALGVPFDRFTQVALIPIAYADHRAFKPAQRLPLEPLLHWDSW
jgi:nitroreductase